MSGNVINHEAEQPEYVGGQHSYASDAEWMQACVSDRETRQAQHLRDSLRIAQQRADRLEQWITGAITSEELTREQRLQGLDLVEEMSPSQRVRIDVERICSPEHGQQIEKPDTEISYEEGHQLYEMSLEPEHEPEMEIEP